MYGLKFSVRATDT